LATVKIRVLIGFGIGSLRRLIPITRFSEFVSRESVTAVVNQPL